jgi:hypothetical protein
MDSDVVLIPFGSSMKETLVSDVHDVGSGGGQGFQEFEEELTVEVPEGRYPVSDDEADEYVVHREGELEADDNKNL